MIKDSWQDLALDAPPKIFDSQFIEWLREVSDRLMISLLDPDPMTTEDKEALKMLYGQPHPELKILYQYTNPWGGYSNGVLRWEQVVTRAVERTQPLVIREESPMNGESDPLKPALWPVSLGSEVDIGAFIDQRGRLAVVGLPVRRGLARPLALGLRNYFVGMALAEALADRRDYDRLDEALSDPDVIAAFGWPTTDPPNHPVLFLKPY